MFLPFTSSDLIVQGCQNDDVRLGHEPDDRFSNDLHKDIKVNYILANPPFNLKARGLQGIEDDKRWKWGNPPNNNGNYAWLSLLVDKLDEDGKAAVVLASGALTSATKDEI